MTLSTRIAVMNEGRFTQIGTPNEIYEHPCNRFTADFVGKINLFEATVIDDGDAEVTLRCEALDCTITLPHAAPLAEGSAVSLAVRPEKIFLAKEPPRETDRTVLRGVVQVASSPRRSSGGGRSSFWCPTPSTCSKSHS